MPGKMTKKPTKSQSAQRTPVLQPSSTSCSCAQIGDPNQLNPISTVLLLPSSGLASIAPIASADPSDSGLKRRQPTDPLGLAATCRFNARSPLVHTQRRTPLAQA